MNPRHEDYMIMLKVSHRLKIRLIKSIYLDANLTLQTSFVRLS